LPRPLFIFPLLLLCLNFRAQLFNNKILKSNNVHAIKVYLERNKVLKSISSVNDKGFIYQTVYLRANKDSSGKIVYDTTSIVNITHDSLGRTTVYHDKHFFRPKNDSGQTTSSGYTWEYAYPNPATKLITFTHELGSDKMIEVCDTSKKHKTITRKYNLSENSSNKKLIEKIIRTKKNEHFNLYFMRYYGYKRYKVKGKEYKDVNGSVIEFRSTYIRLFGLLRKKIRIHNIISDKNLLIKKIESYGKKETEVYYYEYE
jgi:hypothetical protein